MPAGPGGPLGYKILPILGRLQNLLLPLYFRGNVPAQTSLNLRFCFTAGLYKKYFGKICMQTTILHLNVIFSRNTNVYLDKEIKICHLLKLF